MIRVFNSTDRDFTSNGNAVLVPIKARVKNNINGDFYLELTTESRFYKYLNQGNIIIAPTPQGEQAFRIDNQLSRKGDRITLKAKHVFYDSENLVIADSYAVDLTCEQALNHFNAATDSLSPFTMHSDITSLNTFRCVRKSLGEAIGTVIERWGGYLVRDNWDISIKKSIGRDIGVVIRYAKNLKELTAAYDYSGVATKLLPVGKDGILLPELYVYSAIQYDTPYTKVVSISQDLNEDDYPNEEAYQAALIADLRTQAQAMVNKTCIPSITYTLKGMPEKVQDIGDVIEVIDERIGVNITTQVIGYEWDIVTESYANLTFGNFGNTLSGLMATVNSNTKGIVNEAVGEVKTEIKKDIVKLYELLQGSYVVYRGYDILLLDRIPINSAINVIKFSKDGISVSNNGVNGTYTNVYDITTKLLSVPSISLNGKDLQGLLDNKIDYDNLKAGANIKITRKGKILTINATGGTGGVKLYHGTTAPKDSFGSNDDIYIQLAPSTSSLVSMMPNIQYKSEWQTSYSYQENNKVYKIEATWRAGSIGHAFQQITLLNLTPNKEYTVSFSMKPAQTPQCYGTKELLGIVVCDFGQVIDYRGSSYDIPMDGSFTIIDDPRGKVYYQSFFRDDKKHNYTFNFKTTRDYIYFDWYMDDLVDGVSQDFTISDLFITDNSEVSNKISGVYYKINGTWCLDDTGAEYTAGANIQISEENVISATDTTYTAGTNVQISENNVISATDTTYSPFTGATSQAAGAAGLVPAPTTSDVDKVLGAGGAWVKNGTEVEANPSGTATDTLTKLGIDGDIFNLAGSGGGTEVIDLDYDDYKVLTPEQKADPNKLYAVRNVPDPNALPLTVVNGKLCIIYDDGQ